MTSGTALFEQQQQAYQYTLVDPTFYSCNWQRFLQYSCGGYKFIVIHYSNHEFTRGQQLFNIHTHNIYINQSV